MPPMAPLLVTRVAESLPFSYIGLDNMGPFQVKDDGETKKIWVCLFTCMVTYGVHLEIVSNMTSTAFHNCFRRFVSNRGYPQQIVCDNAMHFKLASETIKLVWKDVITTEDVVSYSSNHGIKWNFTVELAPWMGGFYERLVDLFKRSLRKTIGRKLLTFDQFQTVLKESESVINSHPFLNVGDDVNSIIVITSSQFTWLKPFTGVPENEISNNDPDFRPVDSSAENFLHLWKKEQQLLEQVWLN